MHPENYDIGSFYTTSRREDILFGLLVRAGTFLAPMYATII